MALAFDQRTGLTAQSDQDEDRRDKLIAQLKAEEEESLGYAESEVTANQIDALKRYYGEPYGDEEQGRSQVRTREVFEAIEWQRNDYARVFAGGGNVISLEETQEQDGKYAKDAADYLNWILFSDNPGADLLDEFAFDGLLMRRGYIACYWRDKEYRAPETLTGLNIMQVTELMNDPQVEIIAQDFDQESEAGGISLVVKRLKSTARCEIVTVAPEDMRLNGRAVTIDGARYVGRVLRMLAGEAATKWVDYADEILGQARKARGESSTRAEEVRQMRFKDNNDDWNRFASGAEESEEVEVLEEYLRIDLDEDGYPETIRSYRIGDLLLEESEVEENPFGSWTPIRVPHRFMGLSIYDITEDLQRQSTVLTRAGLDTVYQEVVNREAFDLTKIDDVGQMALVSTIPGTKVPVNGPPADAIMPLQGTRNAQTAWDAIVLVKQRLEDRTGATRQTRGLDSDQLTKEHSGKALGMLQLNADARKEMIARNFASGLGQFMCKVYRLVCRNQNEERQAKVGGKWCKFDPRTWNSDLRVKIHAGGLNREHTLMGLSLIGQEQDKVIETLGPSNPLVTSKNRHRYQEELCRLTGWQSAEPFFTEPEDEPVIDEQTGQPQVDPTTGQVKTKPWAPPPQPSPEMAKVEADAKASQAEMQLKTQEAQATLQLQQQKDGAELASKEQEAALKLQLQREESAAKIALEREKAQAEIDLAWAKFEAEQALAREKQAADIALAREQMAHQREQHTEDTQAKRDMHTEKVDASVKISKNREGGSLSE